MRKLVIITGASGGIGSELTKLIAKNNEEYLCHAFARNANKLTHVLGDTRFQNISPIICDFSTDCNELFNSWLQSTHWSEICETVLVLNAFTISPISSISSLKESSILENIKVNIISQIGLVRAVLMRCRLDKLPLRIIQLDSGAAYRPIRGWGLYCAAKAYMSMFLRTLQLEENISVTLFDPGVVDTNMQQEIRAATPDVFPDVDLFRDYHVNGQLADPAKVAYEIYTRYIQQWDP